MGAGHNAHPAEAGGHHAAVRQVANPHRQIDMVAHQVGVTIAEQQTDANLRVTGDKFSDHRENVLASKHRRRRDHQLAFRLLILARRLAFGVFHLLKDPPRGGDIIDPGVGERQFAGGSRQQAYAQRALQFANMAADGGQRHIQRPRRRRHAPQLGHFHQQRHRA